MSKNLNYYALYLKRYLVEQEEPRVNDEEFIDERAESAAAHFEECRLQGMSVDQAQESAISILMEGLSVPN